MMLAVPETMNDERDNDAVRRVVLDTNVLIAAGYAADSASREIVDACLAGRLCALISPDVRREYEHILARALRRNEYRGELQRFVEQAEEVTPNQTPRVVPDDPDDDKLLAAAVAGNAEVLISSDEHLLQLRAHRGVRILTPTQFVGERD